MRKYEIQIRQYDCHPETCCHDNHNAYWIVKVSPLGACFRAERCEWIEGFATRKEAEGALKAYV